MTDLTLLFSFSFLVPGGMGRADDHVDAALSESLK